MSAEYFLYWLKGFHAAKAAAGQDLSKDDISCILTALEQAIKSIHKN